MKPADARVLAELIAAAVERFDFRAPMPPTIDGALDWLRRLVAHVEARDYAAAFELMVAKRQADWSREDIEAFMKRRLSGPGPKREFTEADGDSVTLTILSDPGPYETTTESVVTLARRALDWFIDQRVTDPQKDLPIYASVLLVNGELLTVPCNSSNRIAVLKLLAQRQPVFGFWLIFDAYVHAIDLEHAVAKKRDALLCQLGTREMRRMMRRSYVIQDGAAVFDAPLPDIDDDALRSGNDPYAEIFVSVPPPERPQ